MHRLYSVIHPPAAMPPPSQGLRAPRGSAAIRRHRANAECSPPSALPLPSGFRSLVATRRCGAGGRPGRAGLSIRSRSVKADAGGAGDGHPCSEVATDARTQVAFRCPVCGGRLAPMPGTAGRLRALECGAGHNVAVAREGHVNLLPAGRKAKKGRSNAGDEAGMVRARRAFFDRGHFSRVADGIAQAVAEGLEARAPERQHVAVLDAGCGEGMYIGRVHQTIAGAGRVSECVGVDIAPLAVKLAARKYGAVRFAVANCFHLPFGDASFDCIVTAFSPWPVAEFRRVLKPGGFIVAAGPGENHLLGLKALLYETPISYKPRKYGSSTVGGAVEVTGGDVPPEPELQRRVSYDLHLSEGEDAKNLLQMTPYWWKAKAEQQDRIAQLGSLDTPIDVIICRHRYTD